MQRDARRFSIKMRQKQSFWRIMQRDVLEMHRGWVDAFEGVDEDAGCLPYLIGLEDSQRVTLHRD